MAKIEEASKQDRYVPTAREQAAMDRHAERAKSTPSRATIKSETVDGASRLSPAHVDEQTGTYLFLDTFATSDPNFANAVAHPLMTTAKLNGGEEDATVLTQLLALVQGLAPRNETEAILISQMVAVHNALMVQVRRLGQAGTVEELGIRERAVGRLGKTYALQSETLRKMRSGGNQTVTVSHFHTYYEGQHVHWNGEGPEPGGKPENDNQPHERERRLRVSEREAMPCDVKTNPE